MISLVGASGCGKTTLMKLLLGLYVTDHGDVFFSGTPLSRYGHARFRGIVGTVMQDDVLLSGSIAENISFFDFEPDFDRVFRSARQASIHDDIASMPMGYNSLVGDMGGALSAGQRQRILLARALYREPEILVLDEGTANLDSVTERKIVQMLRGLKMTRICIAHRHQITMASDRVILLSSGTVHEIAKQDLMKKLRGLTTT